MGSHAEVRYRGHERFDVALPARIRVAPAMRGAVKLSKAMGGPEAWVDADVTDVARNGLGIATVLFVPRGAVLDVELFGLAGSGAGPILQATVRVQRVVMTDRRPAYMLGVAFDSLSEDQTDRLKTFLETLGGGADPAGGVSQSGGPGHA